MILDFLASHGWAMAIAIFLARICDVSMGTVRVILVFRGYRILSAVIGFFEVVIWLMAAGKVLTHLDSWYLIVAYAGGFASGNMIGIWMESKLAIGSVLVRAFSARNDNQLSQLLRSRHYHVTEVDGRSCNAAQDIPVLVAFIVAKRRNLPELLQLIESIDPAVFYTVEDLRRVREGEENVRDKRVQRHRWHLISKKK
jgi:uncharacterized protein YebE (UPF0316 family)